MGMLAHVVGARPNFMKMAPVFAELARRGRPQIVIHTGQHYDAQMSDVFFQELGLPWPDHFLGVGGGSHAEQTARAMTALERNLAERRPQAVLVYGDVNSTLAAALVAAKLQLKIVHVEAGLRSFDRSMPEEVNRIVTDQLSDLLLTPSPDADRNLLLEGIARERIVRVGNLMIDTLLRLLPRARALHMSERLGLDRGQYALVTLHRPSNVDDPERLAELVETLAELQQSVSVVLPLHPRTQKRLVQFGLQSRLTALPRLLVTEPLGYLECVGLSADSRLVLTDSGGIQEETTVLGVPCLTLRENTERPITVEQGTNTLTGPHRDAILDAFSRIQAGTYKAGGVPELWDGSAAQRAADVLDHVILGTSRIDNAIDVVTSEADPSARSGPAEARDAVAAAAHGASLAGG